MGDAFRKVTSGEKFRPSARAWNAMLDVAATRDGGEVGPEAPSFGRDADLVKIKNNTNTNQPQFAVMGLDVPLILPADNVTEFRRQITFNGITPLSATHQGKYAILQQPLAVNAIGWGLVAGVTPVVLNTLGTTSRTFAEVVNNNTALLRAGSTGSAQIMWVENTNAAITNAVVRLLGPTVAPTFTGGIVSVTNAASLSNGSQNVRFDHVLYDPQGMWDATNFRFNIGPQRGTWRMQMNLYLTYTGQAANTFLSGWFDISDGTVPITNLGEGTVTIPVAVGSVNIACFGVWTFTGSGASTDYITATVFVVAGGGKTVSLADGTRCVFCIERVD